MATPHTVFGVFVTDNLSIFCDVDMNISLLPINDGSGNESRQISFYFITIGEFDFCIIGDLKHKIYFSFNFIFLTNICSIFSTDLLRGNEIDEITKDVRFLISINNKKVRMVNKQFGLSSWG